MCRVGSSYCPDKNLLQQTFFIKTFSLSDIRKKRTRVREEDNDIRHKTTKLGERAKLVTKDQLVRFYYLHKTSFQDSGGVKNKNKVF